MRRPLHRCYGLPAAAAGFTGAVVGKKKEKSNISNSVADPNLTLMDPDSTFHLRADPDPDPAPPPTRSCLDFDADQDPASQNCADPDPLH
jgi:hypothetical protein